MLYCGKRMQRYTRIVWSLEVVLAKQQWMLVGSQQRSNREPSNALSIDSVTSSVYVRDKI